MSLSNSTDSSTDPDAEAPAPALGSRDNWWGTQDEADPKPRRTGHSEYTGTDTAEFVAHQLALQLVDPVCGETGGDLTNPIFYLRNKTALTPICPYELL